MKNKQFFVGLAAAALLASAVSAEGFTKVNTYTDGMFTDVPATEWYASSVSSAYELGFMKGSGEGIFEPEGNMTVAEAITIASRVNDTYNAKGTAFDQSAGANWYDTYVNYAKANGIITEGQFDSFDRNAKRYEMAEIFAKAVPESFLGAKNNVTEIPDVPSTNAYFDTLKLLYNAGVVMGNDEFGTFLPNNNITRAEAAAIIGRVALPEQRLARTLTDANYGDAYYLLSETANIFSEGASVYDTGWQFDNRNRIGIISNAASHVTDYYNDGKVELWHQIDDVTDGLLGWDFAGSATVNDSGDDGVYFRITDNNGGILFALYAKDGKWFVNGADTGVAQKNGSLQFNMRADLDKGTGTLYINGQKTPAFVPGKVTAQRVYLGCGKTATGTITLNRCDVFQNYLVNEIFLTPVDETALRDWETTGTVGLTTMAGSPGNDTRSAKMAAGATAKKAFNPISGSVVFESYMLFPKTGDAGYVALKSGDATVATLVLNDEGVFNGAGEKLRFHNHNIWQTLRIEADTVNQTVTYKVNGKKVGEGAFNAPAATVDNIVLGVTGGEGLFDDVTVYLTHEYDDYCPVPVPVTDDGYDVILNICSLWREGYHYGWGAVSAYPDVEPVLGYYDEGLVEVADWEIKFMVENGIDVQHLCWYAGQSDIKDPIKRSGHNYALHDGFFNAKYSDMMKFTFMWENSGKNVSSLEQFQTMLWPYWMDYYFKDPRFYTIDNKIVFTVWSVGNFRASFTNDAGCAEAIKWMNEDAKANGFDGVLIFFADGHQQSSDGFANFAKAGGDAAYAYHWNQDGNSASKTISRMQKNIDYKQIHVIPTVSVGFNNIGWSNVRKPLASLEDHKKVLEYIKNDILPKNDGWKAKTLIASTWNEYGEGTYIMPAGVHGFGYLENIAEVISGVTDHSNNIAPTEQQKARLGHLYPKNKTSIFSLDYEDKKQDAGAPTRVIKSFTGDDYYPTNVNEGSLNSDGIITASGKNNDPILNMKEGLVDGVKCSDVVALRIGVKCKIDATFEVFFITEESGNWAQDKSGTMSYKASDDYQELLIYTDKLKNWKGTLKSIRLDPVSEQDAEFSFKSLELLGYDESQFPPTLTIDGKELNFSYDPVMRGGELYVCAEPYAGFFSLNNFYYEWSRYTNVLRIVTKKDHEFIFTVGSQTAKVDGKDVQLSEQVTLRDGLPVIPLFFIYDIEGTNYEVDGKKVTVRMTDAKYNEIIENRVAYQYEFEVPGDIEGLKPAFCTISVVNGKLSGDATAREDQSPLYDPMFTLTDLDVNTQLCNKIVVGMSYQLEDGKEGSSLEIFFATDKSPGLAQKKSARAALEGNVGAMKEYTIDFSENEDWNGTVTQIRVDPIACGGHFDIDYIRFVIDEETLKANQAKLEAERKAAEERAAAGYVIENGDAEESGKASVWFSAENNAKISIIEDPDKPGNHIISVVPATNGQVWVYCRQNVRYLPGLTYHVEADVYPVGTANGDKDVKTHLACNAVYKGSDGKNDHVVKQYNGLETGKWTHIDFDFKVEEDSTDRSGDQFTFYANPIEGVGIEYRLDNITVKKKED